jgi:cytochrome c oxidase subunit 1
MILPGLARWQPYIFGGGMTILILFMLGAGTLGVARRHWDMDFTGSVLSFEYSGMAYTLMGIGAFGGVIGVIGGAAFLLITVGSLLFGKKLDPSAGFLQSFGKSLADTVYSIKRPDAVPLAPRPVVEEHGSAGFEAPGTFALALLLLVCFVVYYFINWNYLASVWPLG